MILYNYNEELLKPLEKLIGGLEKKHKVIFVLINCYCGTIETGSSSFSDRVISDLPEPPKGFSYFPVLINLKEGRLSYFYNTTQADRYPFFCLSDAVALDHPTHDPKVFASHASSSMYERIEDHEITDIWDEVEYETVSVRRKDCFEPSLAIPIRTPVNSIYGAVYCVEPKRMLLYVDIFSDITRILTDKWEAQVLYLFKYAMYCLSGDEKDKPLWTEDILPTLNTDAISTFLKKRDKEIVDKLEGIKTEIRSQMHLLDDLYRRKEELSGLLCSRITENKVKEQLELIRDNPRVMHVNITDHLLVVITDMIEIDLYGNKYPIGYMKISINLKDGKVNFNNLTDKRYGFNSVESSHPHDTGSGAMCLGKISHYIVELIHENQLSSLVKLLINFASSVNVNDDAGKTMYVWQV